MTEIVVGSCKVAVDAEWVEIQDSPGRGLPEISGKALLATYSTTDGGLLRAAFVVLSDKTMVMKGMALIDGPDKYSRLVRAGSMEVAEFDTEYFSCRVRAMRYNDQDRQNVANVSWPDLKSLVGDDAKSLLSDLGAIKFGTAGEILGITNRTANQEAMIFPQNDLRSLFAVWAMTRVIPVMKDYGRDGVGVLN